MISRNRIKNWIILILIIVLLWTWFGPYLKDLSITGAIVNLFSGGNAMGESLEEGSYVLGAEEAPVKIVIFSDFQCPFCAKANSEALAQIREDYVKTGKAKLVFKNLPLSFHSLAEPAALAARCAGEQEKFWDYHDELFENQDKLSSGYFRELAGELGLNREEFNKCLTEGKGREQIRQDQQAAREVRITGTPGFIVNGETLAGAQPFSIFKELIEKKLSESRIDK